MKTVFVLVAFAAVFAVAYAEDDDFPGIVIPEYPDDDFPGMVIPEIPDPEEKPITVDVPGGPTINIVVNVNSPQQHEEIEPTPIQVVDDLEIETRPVQGLEDFEADDFVPDPDVYY